MKKFLAVPVVAAVVALLLVTFPSWAGAAATASPAASAAPTTGVIKGKVLGPNHQPLAGTCVVMFTPTSIVSFPTTSTGAYRATGLSGEVEVVGQICSGSSPDAPVVYDDHPGLEGNSNIDQDIDVTPGSVTPDINIDLVKGGALSATVTDAVTNAPVVGADICPYLPALDADGDQVQSGYCQFTNSSGKVDLTNVVAGSTILEAFGGSSGYDSTYYDGQSSFQTATPINVTYAHTAKVSFTMTAGG